MKYLIRIMYDGRNFCGYQSQTNGRTVQDELLKALSGLFGKVDSMSGCSRTDSGVHALNYYVSFASERQYPEDVVVRALNSYLPHDISVTGCRYVDESFHARYSVISKEYIYKCDCSPVRNPFREGLVFHYGKHLDTERMNKAASFLLGEHDFSSYMSSGSSVTDTERTIYSAYFEYDGTICTFHISGNGFLYNMVRIITGTMIHVSEGKISPDEIPGITTSANREKAGPTAPPQGLYLNSVSYGGLERF